MRHNTSDCSSLLIQIWAQVLRLEICGTDYMKIVASSVLDQTNFRGKRVTIGHNVIIHGHNLSLFLGVLFIIFLYVIFTTVKTHLFFTTIDTIAVDSNLNISLVLCSSIDTDKHKLGHRRLPNTMRKYRIQ